MLDVIRKKISIDKSRSHTVGIVPFIPYNEDRADVRFVSMGDESGNWGGFPLDIAIMKETTSTGFADLNIKSRRFKDGEEGAIASSSTNRLRYAELARRYYEIQKMLYDGIFTIGIRKYEVDDGGKMTCEKDEEKCKYDKTGLELVSSVVLTKNFDKIAERPTVYNFKPVPADEFYDVGNGVYKPTHIISEGDEDIEPFTNLGDIYDNSGVYIEEGKYYVIISDYDKYVAYEDAWKYWWENNDLDSNSMFPVPDGDYKFCRAFEKYFIGKVEVPDEITGIRVPQYVYYSDIEEYKDWFEKNGMTTERAVAKKPEDLKKAFEDRGGLAFYNFLRELGDSAPWIPSLPKVHSTYGVGFVEPYISLPITLEDNHEYGGIYESYLYSYSEKDEDFYEAYSDFSGYGGYIRSWYEPKGEIVVDSQLSAVIDRQATEVEGITGVWGEFNDDMSNIFKCVFKNGNNPTGERSVLNVRIDDNNYGHWECNRLYNSEADGVLCGDGEHIRSGQMKYRTLTLLECIRDVVEMPSIGATYYFLVRHDNCEEVPFRIPYTVNSFHNMTETNDPEVFTGDYVTSIENTESSWTIQYVIGGTARSEDGGLTFTAIPRTGIKYEETYPYKEKQVLLTCIDGHDNVRVVYNWIDTEGSKRDVYSEEYRLYRKTNTATVIGMEVGSIMTGDSKSMINALVFTRDGSDSLPDETKNTLDVIIDRGMAAAFERHFKLSECNTFEDLKNYGNNFYNL